MPGQEGIAPIDQVIRDIGDTIESLGCLKLKDGMRGRGFIGFRCVCTDEATWKVLLDHFLLNARGFRYHICHRPFVETAKRGNEDYKHVAWYWFLQFRADDLVQASTAITTTLLKGRVHAAQNVKSTPPTPRKIPPAQMGVATMELDEVPVANPEAELTDPSVVHINPNPIIKHTEAGTIVEREVAMPWRHSPEQKNPNGRGARPIKD